MATETRWNRDVTRGGAVALAVTLAAWFAAPVAVAAPPPVDTPPVSGQKSPKDYAVVIANSDYYSLNDVPYARRDADAFEQWLLSTRGVPTLNLLRVNGATRGKLTDAVATAAKQVAAGGTLWVYYSGHGLGMRVGGADAEQVLVGVNAVASASEIGDAVVPVSKLEAIASGSGAARVVFVLDACFNNKDASGAPVVRGSFAVPSPRSVGSAKVTVWTASSEDETAQWYDEAQHGAFTYFAVGALSGWADGVDGAADGSVTLDEASLFVTRALARSGILGQSPQLASSTGSPMGAVASGKLASMPPALFASGAGGAPSGGAGPVPGAVSGGFGFNGSLSAELASQVCDDDAKTKAEAAQLARAESASAKLRAEATAAWRGLEPQLDGCLKLDDRKACIAAAEQFIAAGKTASVTVGESREVVKTSCGDRSRVVASRTVPVSVSEVGLAEAKLAALKAPKGASGGADWVSPTLGVMKWIPAGTFTMGSPDGVGDSVEHPAHSVRLTKGYYLMEHEVTQGEWKSVMGSNPSRFTACGPKCPVEQVSWDDAVAFAAAASRRDGVTYRLPTEAEWEYAARGGGASAYAGSDNVDAVAWYASNSGGKTNAVCGKQRNGFGLCDMSGNVWEWTADWYGNYGGATVDPTGAASGSYRVFRGGSWGSDPVDARVAVRIESDPGGRYDSLGLRLLRSVP
jgi:formylglycine-generating enzyme required for sulfatase activity